MEELIVHCFHCCRIGGESLAVAQNTYAVSWFKGRELNMVFGLQLSFSRVVSRTCSSSLLFVASFSVINLSTPLLTYRHLWAGSD